MHRKPHLPEKSCLCCGRPFAWRKKVGSGVGRGQILL
ncbi:DUF2256 domain-containing protein [Comamonas testosteroni]